MMAVVIKDLFVIMKKAEKKDKKT